MDHISSSITKLDNNNKTLQGYWGDYPITGTTAVVPPAGYYFASVTGSVDSVIASLQVNGVAYTTDSYLTKTIYAGQWHPFMDKVTSITLTSGTLQAWLKPL